MQRRHFLQTVAAAATTLASTTSSPADERKPRIKIGQIGVGHAHATKLGAYRKSADYEVVGIVEPDDALRKRPNRRPPTKT
jgi:hypothetical protein